MTLFSPELDQQTTYVSGKRDWCETPPADLMAAWTGRYTTDVFKVDEAALAELRAAVA